MDRPFGEIVTFYSYKGGTGRSMVMANVAHLLAASRSYGGKRVLAIDWDLEAPGLELFFRARFEGRFGSSKKRGYAADLRAAPGLIDFLTAVRSHYDEHHTSGPLPESMARDPVAQGLFRDAMTRIPLKKYLLDVDGAPSLSLMKAGSQKPVTAETDAYWQKVRSFDWEDFYKNFGSFFTHFREHLVKRFDFVLIDSRTGLTDIGGICTRVMPQKLVVVFAPNRANIEGVQKVARRSVIYRMNSRDPRSLMVFPLASRIDASASKLRGIWWRGGTIRDEKIAGYQSSFEDLFKDIYKLDACDLGDFFDETQIPHDGDYSYGEQIAAEVDGTEDRFGIGYACDQLTRRILRFSAPWEEMEDEAEDGKPPYRILVSHGQKDSEFAGALIDLFADLFKERVAMARVSEGISDPPDDQWQKSVKDQFASSDAVLVVLGGNGRGLSSLLSQEITIATTTNKLVLPVAFSNKKEPPQVLRGYQIARGSDLSDMLHTLSQLNQKLDIYPESVFDRAAQPLLSEYLKKIQILTGSEGVTEYQAAISRGLSAALDNADRAYWDIDETKVVVFSDLHRGCRDHADDFRHSENNYERAINYYFEEGYTLVVLGDSEELWEGWPKKTVRSYRESFQLEAKFNQESDSRYFKLWGNHDDLWSYPRQVEKHLSYMFGSLSIPEALDITMKRGGDKIGRIFLVHGHQGIPGGDKWGKYSRHFVRWIWRPIQRLFKVSLATPATDRELRGEHDRALYNWAAARNDVVLIAGHTHNSVFGKLEGTGREHDRLCYFNTGCCSFYNGDVTGIEIADGEVRLVRWSNKLDDPANRVDEAEDLGGVFANLRP